MLVILARVGLRLLHVSIDVDLPRIDVLASAIAYTLSVSWA